MRLSNTIIALSILFIASFSLSAQELDPSLLKEARRGDPEAMYKVGMAYESFGDNGSLEEAFQWFSKSADLNYAPAQAMLAYHLRAGLGTRKDHGKALIWAQRASTNNDVLGIWISSLYFKDTNKDLFRDSMHRAFLCRYPTALLYYAKLYSTGSAEYGVVKDLDESDRLIAEAAEYHLPYAVLISSIKQYKETRDADKLFDSLNYAAEAGVPIAKSLIASMYLNGQGVEKDVKKAFTFLESSSSAGEPFGIEELADCYRIGIEVIQNQQKAFEVYDTVKDISPRAKYLLACYKNEGIGTSKDTKEALSLFLESAEEEFVFSEAILGISLFTGSSPCEEKDPGKSFRYLDSAIRNASFEDVPVEVRSKVLEYAAACFRYGFGTTVDVGKADVLYKKSLDLRSGLSLLSNAPIGLVGPVTMNYIVNHATSFSAADIPEDAFDYITLDYPRIAPEVPIETDSPEVVDKPEEIDYVSFTDQELETYLVSCLDSSGDGHLSEEELASVVSLEGIKLQNTISSFNEFRFFTGLNEIPLMYFQGFSKMSSIIIPETLKVIQNGAFLGCTSLVNLFIPPEVRIIGDWAFAGCENLKSIICQSVDPPEVGDNFISYSDDITIYVPVEAVNAYKNAPGWKKYSQRIKSVKSKSN